MENILHLSLAYASFLLYKKMDFCARACDAARDVGPMVRGSERENMFTSCLADSRLEQVDMCLGQCKKGPLDNQNGTHLLQKDNQKGDPPTSVLIRMNEMPFYLTFVSMKKEYAVILRTPECRFT